MENESLEKVREEIGRVDSQMIELFEKRMKLAEDVAAYKKLRALPIYDEKQEEKVIERNVAKVNNNIYVSYYKTFIKNMMDISKDYQKSLVEDAKIAYAGEKGAFAYIAAKNVYGEKVIINYHTFADAYKSVEGGKTMACVLPIENSYAGSVEDVIDLIYNGSLYINYVYELKIWQNLIGIKGAKIGDIKTVISHPQALSQCREFIEEHNLKTESCVNTAIAAMHVKELNDKSVACIASTEVKNLYDLDVIEKNINTSYYNNTRFACLSRTNNVNETNDAFALMFTVDEHKAGTLVEVLNIIYEHNINMTSLKSRPLRQGKFTYYFFVEAEGSSNNDNFKEMYDELKKVCLQVKLVGSYRLNGDV